MHVVICLNEILATGDRQFINLCVIFGLNKNMNLSDVYIHKYPFACNCQRRVLSRSMWIAIWWPGIRDVMAYWLPEPLARSNVSTIG